MLADTAESTSVMVRYRMPGQPKLTLKKYFYDRPGLSAVERAQAFVQLTRPKWYEIHKTVKTTTTVERSDAP
jgi:hypothetical protein